MSCLSLCLCLDIPRAIREVQAAWDNMLFVVKTDKLLDVFILCTRASHRGRGLAGQLVKTALENAKSEGLTGVFSMGLSNYSQRIFRRMGFQERNSLEYSQYTQVNRH